MTDEITPDQLRQELKDLDNELAELRRVTGDVQSRRGEDSDTSLRASRSRKTSPPS
jgi:hypothetical protein